MYAYLQLVFHASISSVNSETQISHSLCCYQDIEPFFDRDMAVVLVWLSLVSIWLIIEQGIDYITQGIDYIKQGIDYKTGYWLYKAGYWL